MNSDLDKRVTLIAGPTASGKSAMALELAERTPSVIINADAMQVYADLRVLTSRPDPEDEARTEHQLYGVVPAREAFSAARWLEAANEAICKAWKRQVHPIVLGGTGLYFRALEYGLAPIPDVPPEVRKHWRERLDADGAGVLHRELQTVLPDEAARLNRGDGQRILRALEVHESTGRAISSFFTEAHASSILAEAAITRMVLMPDREVLYERCNDRFDAMLNEGALDEVRELLDQQLDPDLPSMKAIGVRALGAFIRGEVDLDDAVATAKRETRNYAKRQMTWIRGQMADWPVVSAEGT